MSATTTRVRAAKKPARKRAPAKRKAPMEFVKYWPNKRSRVCHLYVKGPGAGDASLCGQILTDTAKASQYVVVATERPPLPVLAAPKSLDWDLLHKEKTLAGCRIVASDDNYIMLEEPPTKRLYFFSGKQYHIQFPWLYYYIRKNPHYGHYSIYRLFSSPKQITKLKEPLFKLPLPNQYDYGLCYSGSSHRVSAPQGVADAITIWWMQNANHDNFPRSHGAIQKLKASAGIAKNQPFPRHKMFETWQNIPDETAINLRFAATRMNIGKLFPETKDL